MKALSFQLQDLKSFISILPNPLKDLTVTHNFLTSIFLSSLNYLDPITSYLPADENYFRFTDFLESRFSPKSVISSSFSISEKIDQTYQIILSKFPISNDKGEQVLFRYVNRYWSEQLSLLSVKVSSFNPTLQKLIVTYKNASLQSIQVPQPCLKFVQLDSTVDSFMKSSQTLVNCLDLFFECLFFECPFDIANQFYNIYIRMNAFCSQKLEKKAKEEDVNETIVFLWKLLILSTEVPYPELIIDFVNEYFQLKLIPAQFYDYICQPIQAMNQVLQFIKESK